jgi:hypothetical protein
VTPLAGRDKTRMRRRPLPARGAIVSLDTGRSLGLTPSLSPVASTHPVSERLMTEIHPYLNFNGNCREAMTFYQQWMLNYPRTPLR